MRMVRLLSTLWLCLFCQLPTLKGFSVESGGATNNNNSNNNNHGSSQSSLFDRFRPHCPADFESIRQFQPSLVPDYRHENDTDVWVAVYRSNNNQPSVLVRDEFLHKMRSATQQTQQQQQLPIVSSTTTMTSSISSSSFVNPAIVSKSQRDAAPVAVARLSKQTIQHSSSDNDTLNENEQTVGTENSNHHVYVIDSVRCILKKESMESSCDGGSEHTEALATAIDALLLHYVSRSTKINDSSHNNNNNAQWTSAFEGIIRVKSTLVAATLFEDRGFVPITDFVHNDMTVTHISSLDRALSCYARRCVASNLGPTARCRAVDLVSWLGRIDREDDILNAQRIQEQERRAKMNHKDEQDPWANIKQFI